MEVYHQVQVEPRHVQAGKAEVVPAKVVPETVLGTEMVSTGLG